MNSVQVVHVSLAVRYKYMLSGYVDQRLGPPTIPEFAYSHLIWMCSTIIKNHNNYPADKMGRWIGFIQAGCIYHGLTTVEKERDFSRPLFHTAYDLANQKIPITSDPSLTSQISLNEASWIQSSTRPSGYKGGSRYKGNRAKYTLRIPSELQDVLKNNAYSLGVPLNDYIIDILLKTVKKDPTV